MIGSTLGNYRIERQLGHGGMGAVYVGTHALLGRTAAIKVLLPKYSQDQPIVQRFFNEARAATAIKHPGIVEIYDFGYDPSGSAYIVMELCEGESLAARIRRQRNMPVRVALTIARQIAGTLAAAHEAGIVHRDLKPDNVFVVPDPDVEGGERIKLLDFGIAKLMTDAPGLAQTRTGAIMGTPHYMSPEQCRGAGQVDHRSDIYSLGCILFELMCGRVPFLGEGAGDIISGHIMTPAPAPSSLAPSIHPELEQLIVKLLAKKPEQRLESATAVGAELDRIAELVPESSTTGDLEVAEARTLLGHVDPAAATAASQPPTRAVPELAMPLVATTAPASNLVPTVVPLPSAAQVQLAIPIEPPARRSRTGLVLAIAGVVVAVVIVVAVLAGRSPSSSSPADAQVVVPAPPDATPLDATADHRPVLVIGELGGHELTADMRAVMRPRISTLIGKLAPELRPVLIPAEAADAGAAHRALFIDGTLDTLELAAGKLKCKLSVVMASYPEKAIFGLINGGASVIGVKSGVRDINLAAADCVDATIEDLFEKRILPLARTKLGLPPPPP